MARRGLERMTPSEVEQKSARACVGADWDGEEGRIPGRRLCEQAAAELEAGTVFEAPAVRVAGSACQRIGQTSCAVRGIGRGFRSDRA